MRRTLSFLLVLALVGGAAWILRMRDAATGRLRELRPSLDLPSPGLEERLDRFFELYASGQQREIARRPFPVWQRIGGRALVDLGRPATDYLLAEERTRRYEQSPSILANVLALLPRMATAVGHPRLYPFLLHWLDPASYPRESDRGTWPESLRKPIFALFARDPREAAVAACRDELRREERGQDLRRIAIAVLMHTGHGADLREQFDRLPPNPDEQEPDLRLEILGLLANLAHPQSPPEQIEEARAWTPVLTRLLESERTAERIHAAGVLLRLGDTAMVDVLKREYREGTSKGDAGLALAWSALFLLARDQSDPFPLEEYLRFARTGERRFETVTSLQRLSIDYIEEPEVQALLWNHVESSPWIHWPVFLRLVRVDRPRTVALLRRMVEGDDSDRHFEAIRITTREMLTELGPAIAEVARKTTVDTERIYYYSALAKLGAEAGYPLMLGDFRPDNTPDLRSAALAGLFAYGHEEGLDRLAAALRDGDRLVLRTLFLRAQADPQTAVPDPLWPAVVDSVAALPGEDARLEALYVVRLAGRLAVVEEGLQRAYRTEPSRRVAREIGDVLMELAYR